MATATPARTLVGRAVIWAGLAVGTCLTVLAVMHGIRVPRLEVVLSVIATWALLTVLAVVAVELLRRHHRAIGRHAARYGKRGAVATARHARRHGGTALQRLVAKTAPRWENREYLPLMFRKARARAHAGSGEGTTEGTTSMAEEDASKMPARDGEPGVTRRTPVHCADHPGRDCELVEYADGGREHVALAEGDPGGIIRRYRAMWQNRNNQSETKGTTAMTTGTGPSYKGGDFSLTTSHRGGSKIAPEHRARRAAARTGGSMPAAWGPVIALAADFEPEDDGQLLDWMNGQVTGMGGYGEALVDLYDHCTSVIGIDPAAAALLHDVADAVAHAAESMAAAKAKFTDHYEMPREFAANGGLMTHDGRWVTGEGA